MKAYNVEFFDENLVFTRHTSISEIDYAEDYISPETNSITVESIDVNLGEYVLIANDQKRFFGVVSNVSHESKDLVTVTFKPFLTFFDIDILYDTNIKTAEQSLERYISQSILSNFSYNEDDKMNLPGVTTTHTSETYNWWIDIESDVEDSHYAIVNLLYDIIIPAFTQYSIRIAVSPDVAHSKIDLYVGKNPASEVTLEADLPNIYKKYVTVKKADSVINKLIVYNEEKYTEKLVFYRHPNGSYDKTDINRITPVVQEMRSAAAKYESETVTKTFATVASELAESVFAASEYDNLIELTMAIDDSLYLPTNLEVGQVANVISDETKYVSVLSGYEMNNTTITLIFGLIRVDLTKMLRKKGKYGN